MAVMRIASVDRRSLRSAASAFMPSVEKVVPGSEIGGILEK